MKIKKFITNLLDGMGHINMFPDIRSIDEIMTDYSGPSEMKYMILGFFLIVAGILCGLCLVIEKYEVTGGVVVLASLATWAYAQVRKVKKK